MFVGHKELKVQPLNGIVIYLTHVNVYTYEVWIIYFGTKTTNDIDTDRCTYIFQKQPTYISNNNLAIKEIIISHTVSYLSRPKKHDDPVL